MKTIILALIILILVLVLAFFFLLVPKLYPSNYGNCGIITKDNFESCVFADSNGCSCLVSSIADCRLAHLEIKDLESNRSYFVFINNYKSDLENCSVNLVEFDLDNNTEKVVDCTISKSMAKNVSDIFNKIYLCYNELAQ